MGKHAAPRPERQLRRAGAVSAATVLLCLSAGGTALASTAPVPVPAAGDLTPPPVPQPVADAVKQVTDVTGLPDPLASTSPKPAHHRHHRAKTATTAAAPAPTRHPAAKASRPTPAPRPTSLRFTGGGYSIPGLRAANELLPSTATVRTPAIAAQPPVTRIVQAADTPPITAGSGIPDGEHTGRTLLLALATMLLGGLASGHVRVAQTRTVAW